MDSSFEFEEISLESNANDSSPTPKPLRMRAVRRESLASQLNKLKSNPDTFDYEAMLKQIKRPVKFSSTSPPVVERLLFSHQLSQNKKRFLAQQKETEEKKQCTFKPNVHSPSRKRSFEQFYMQQQMFENKKHEKIEEMKEDKDKKMKASLSGEIRPAGMSRGSKIILLRKENLFLPESTISDMGNLYKTISVSQGVFKAMGRPPLPKSPRMDCK